MVLPQFDDDARFVGATDLLARIKACNFFRGCSRLAERLIYGNEVKPL